MPENESGPRSPEKNEAEIPTSDQIKEAIRNYYLLKPDELKNAIKDGVDVETMEIPDEAVNFVGLLVYRLGLASPEEINRSEKAWLEKMATLGIIGSKIKNAIVNAFSMSYGYKDSINTLPEEEQRTIREQGIEFFKDYLINPDSGEEK